MFPRGPTTQIWRARWLSWVRAISVKSELYTGARVLQETCRQGFILKTSIIFREVRGSMVECSPSPSLVYDCLSLMTNRPQLARENGASEDRVGNIYIYITGRARSTTSSAESSQGTSLFYLSVFLITLFHLIRYGAQDVVW